jgi:hypothetical protein
MKTSSTRAAVLRTLAVVAVAATGMTSASRGAAAAQPMQYLSIPGVAFVPTSASNYSNAGYVTADPWAGWRWGLSANPYLTAPVELPDGAHIVSLTVNYRDTSETGYTLAHLYVYAADHYGDGAPFHGYPDTPAADCEGATGLCSGLTNANGQGSISADLGSAGLVVDNQRFQYTVVVYTHTSGENQTGDEAINSAIVGYVLPHGRSGH